MTPFEQSIHEGLDEMLSDAPFDEVSRQVEMGIDKNGEVIAQATIGLGINHPDLPAPIEFVKAQFEVRQREIDLNKLKEFFEDDEDLNQ